MRLTYRLLPLATFMVVGTCSATMSECHTLFAQAQTGSATQVASQLDSLPAECDSLAVAVLKAQTYLQLANTSTGSDQKGYAQSALNQLEAAKNKEPDQRTKLIIYGYMAEAQYYLERRANTASLLDDCDFLIEQQGLSLPEWLGTFKKSFELSLVDNPLTDEEFIQQLTGKGHEPRQGRVNIRVLFETDEAVLTPAGHIQTDKIANRVAELVKQGRHILIAGHTDKRGDADHNLALSERRAETVRQRLQQRYPSYAALFTSEGYGESRLRYDGDTDNDHELNRRVEVVLLD